jgi:chorismate synthase
VKGVEIGEGFDVAGRRGSLAHDPIHWDATTSAYRRSSDLAGGHRGRHLVGELIVARAAMKPLATLNKPTLATVDVVTKEETVSFKERTDVTAVPAMGVVAETMVALVLATEALRTFGGDSLDERGPQPRRLPRLPWLRAPGHLVLVGMMGSGKTTAGRGSPPRSAGPSSTATTR